jgi:sugar lactone lactonase YvrE
VNSVSGVAVDKAGNVFIADEYNRAIRKVDHSGVISTVSSLPSFPISIQVDDTDNIYFACNDYSAYTFSHTGVISLLAGNGSNTASGDGGLAIAAGLDAKDVTFDGHGNYYIADAYNNRIRKVDSWGIITTYAGNGIAAWSGDGGQATSASLSNPNGVVMDEDGDLYIADYSNNRVRKVSSEGIITTVAGITTGGYRGDGWPATVAMIDNPTKVTLDHNGDLYIADNGNGRVRKVNICFPTAVTDPVYGVNEVIVYPNPTNDQFKVRLPEGGCSIVLTDITGKAVYHTIAQDKNLEINVRQFPRGVYIIKVTGSDFIQNEKILIR